jgi:signal transduction histidine kinase
MKEDVKNFHKQIVLFPIVFVIVAVSIVTIYNIKTLKEHQERKINQIKKEYIQEQKEDIQQRVRVVKDSIEYQGSRVDSTQKDKLRKRVDNAINITQSIYNKYNGKLPEKQIKELIKETLSSLRFDEGRGYFLLADTVTNKSLIHPLKKFRDVDMSNFKDKKGLNILQAYKDILSKQDGGYVKIYFNKPNNPNKEFPKLVYVKEFKPFNWIIGTGEYEDVTKEFLQKMVINRFLKSIDKNRYIFIYKLHDINGGENFATMILNQNRPDLVGKKISDSYKDAHGKQFRKEFLKKIRENGEAYVKYWYKKPTDGSIQPKMSYFYHQKDWNWIIASGFYYDDLEKHIENIENDIKNDIYSTIKSTVILTIILLLITVAISVLLSNRLNKFIHSYIKKLKSSEQKLKQAQHIAKIGSWKHTFSDDKLIWSDEVYNIFEIKKNTPIKTYTGFLSVIHPDDKGYVAQLYNEALLNKTSYDIEHRLLMNDGRIKYVREKCTFKYNDKKDVVSAIGTVQDITDKVEQQQKLQERDKLLFEQSKMASMGEMIGNIAHQWRQPLSVISTVASGILLRFEFGDFDKDRIVKELESLEESAQYLSQTIDDFQNYLKPSKQTQFFNIEDVVNKNINMFGKGFISKGIHIITHVKGSLYEGNENELLQVIINILNNAKDAFIDSDKNIENKIILIELYETKKNIILTIQDSAGGVPEDIKNKIFEAYFTTKHQSKGTGLGMYMSYQIIKNSFKGTLCVENKTFNYDDKSLYGACFTIVLPLKN